MWNEKYSMFSFCLIGYTDNINRKHVQRERSSAYMFRMKKGEMEYEEKNTWYYNGTGTWTFACSLRIRGRRLLNGRFRYNGRWRRILYGGKQGQTVSMV